MCEYLILQHPGHNRVYYNAAGEMALAELKIASKRLSVNITEVNITEIAKVRYLYLSSDNDLSDSDFEILSRLSFVFALFKYVKTDTSESLLPILQSEYEYVDSKISSLLKYAGKTNELFTKMMVNVALLASDFNYSDNINLLDPVAGKGTTLFEASVYGFNAHGIEIEPKSVHELSLFFKKYIQTERYKNAFDKRMVSGKNKNEAVFLQEFVYAKSKEAFKNEENRKKIGVVCGNSAEADKYFKKNTFHLIVGDLPYGIAHGNTAAQKQGSITRNPSELLSICVPQWSKVLKKGGVIVVAWNAFVVSKHQLSKVFEENSLEVISDEAFGSFEHMVDKSIKRDIIIAKKI